MSSAGCSPRRVSITSKSSGEMALTLKDAGTSLNVVILWLLWLRLHRQFAGGHL